MIYIAFNKPFQVLSQFKELDGKANLKNFIALPEKPKAAGRLDYDSEGLLFLSDDDQFIYNITNPSREIEKEYLTQVEGTPAKSDLKKFESGIITQTENYAPGTAEIIPQPEFLWERTPSIRVRKNIPTTWLRIVISEGKNRQVRKMTAHIGFPTLRLIRVRIGKYTLGNLEPGKFRYISKREIFG
ncbi:MAG: pseudouridine synthase [Leptospira sp.]|nr:pseudouridine synthase [Leptospira sp.]